MPWTHQTSNDEWRCGPAKVTCGGEASFVGRRTTVCGNESRSGPGEPGWGIESSDSCEQREERQTQDGRERPNGGRCTVEKARIWRGWSVAQPESHARWRETMGYQRNGSDPHVAGCSTGVFLSGRVVLQKQIWRVSRWRGLRARPRGGLCDRLEHEWLRADGGEEPVLLVGTLMYRAFSTLTEFTQAGKLSEVEFRSLMERCVICFKMYEPQRNAGRLFLHEHPWDVWFRGLSFFNEVAEKDGVHGTKGDLCRFQLATKSIDKGSWFMSNSKCIIVELSKRCYSKDGQAQNHMENFVVVVLNGLKRERNLCESDWFNGSWRFFWWTQCARAWRVRGKGAEELQNVFDSISGSASQFWVVMSVSRKVEIHYMNLLEVYRKQWRIGAFVSSQRKVQTWTEAMTSDQIVEKNSNVGTRRCQERSHRWDRSSVWCFLFPKLWCGNLGQVVRRLEDFGLGCFEGTLSSWSDQIWRLSCHVNYRWKAKFWSENSRSRLYGTRRATHNCENKWERVIIDSGFAIGTWSPAIVCCREREWCGLVQGKDFTAGDSMQLAWIEFRFNDGVFLRGARVEARTMAMTRRSRSWTDWWFGCVSESWSQIWDWSPAPSRDSVSTGKFGRCNLKSVTTLAVKI